MILPERASGFHPDQFHRPDTVVEVIVDGRQRCRDKVKRDYVRELGLEIDECSVPFIDRLTPASLEHEPFEPYSGLHQANPA